MRLYSVYVYVRVCTCVFLSVWICIHVLREFHLKTFVHVNVICYYNDIIIITVVAVFLILCVLVCCNDKRFISVY